MVRRRRLGLLLAGAVLSALWVVVAVAPAVAACHAFTVSAEPSSVGEGGSVTITVSRDANVAPSNVDVETIDEAAQAGTDYGGVARRTVSFSNETEQAFDVDTVDDTEAEQAETFRVHLSNPGGCAVNPNYVVGPDAMVTIVDNDEPTTTAPPSPPTTGAPTTTAKPANVSGGATSTTAATSTTVSPTTTAGTSTSATDDGAPPASAESALRARADSDSDGDAWAIVVGVAAVGGAGAAAAVIWRRRAHARGTGSS